MVFQPGQITRSPNRHYRSREYLTPDEVKQLIDVAELRGRYPVRDKALLLMMFRHGLRATEASRMKWDAVMLSSRSVWVERVKNSVSGTHPLQEDEAELLQEMKGKSTGNFVFKGERGERLSEGAISKIVERCGELAELPMPVHPHMLRHSCGYYLAEQGIPTRDIQEYLGHRNIQNTVKYTAGNPARFNRIVWSV
jgi:type 1 fimbriae regulatory protein FimB/type 1 fimbriae regulatory protein FimE